MLKIIKDKFISC